MNMNFFSNALLALAALVPALTAFFGCSTTADGSFDCSATWLPPSYGIYAGIGLTVLSFIAKSFSGGGTIKQNLMNPKAVIVPQSEAKKGVVTLAQVESPK